MTSNLESNPGHLGTRWLFAALPQTFSVSLQSLLLFECQVSKMSHCFSYHMTPCTIYEEQLSIVRSSWYKRATNVVPLARHWQDSMANTCSCYLTPIWWSIAHESPRAPEFGQRSSEVRLLFGALGVFRGYPRRPTGIKRCLTYRFILFISSQGITRE